MKFCDESRARDLPVGHAFCSGLPACRFRPDEELAQAKDGAPPKTPPPETPGGGDYDVNGQLLRIGDHIEFLDGDSSVIFTGYIDDFQPAVRRWRCSTEEGAIFYAPSHRIRYHSGF